jgi:hypothetical protein
MTESVNNIVLMLPEDYAAKHNICLKTVYNRIKSGKLKSQKKYKKTFVEV